MVLQLPGVGESKLAFRTLVGLVLGVRHLVPVKVVGIRERGSAQGADEGSDRLMLAHDVHLQVGEAVEGTPALLARVSALVGV